jgi:hypothetical protein
MCDHLDRIVEKISVKRNANLAFKTDQQDKSQIITDTDLNEQYQLL